MVGDFGCYVILAGRLLLEVVCGGLCSLVCVVVYACKFAFVGCVVWVVAFNSVVLYCFLVYAS